MLDIKIFSDEELIELYNHWEQMSRNERTESSFINDFMDKYYGDADRLALAFLPINIMGEISRRWLEEKTRK